LENPNTWTAATNVIEAAIRYYNKDVEDGMIGLSLPAYIEDYLATYGFLNQYGLEVVGIKDVPRRTDGKEPSFTNYQV
jgi:hypothetical protein